MRFPRFLESDIRELDATQPEKLTRTLTAREVRKVLALVLIGIGGISMIPTDIPMEDRAYDFALLTVYMSLLAIYASPRPKSQGLAATPSQIYASFRSRALVSGRLERLCSLLSLVCGGVWIYCIYLAY